MLYYMWKMLFYSVPGSNEALLFRHLSIYLICSRMSRPEKALRYKLFFLLNKLNLSSKVKVKDEKCKITGVWLLQGRGSLNAKSRVFKSVNNIWVLDSIHEFWKMLNLKTNVFYFDWIRNHWDNQASHQQREGCGILIKILLSHLVLLLNRLRRDSNKNNSTLLHPFSRRKSLPLSVR